MTYITRKQLIDRFGNTELEQLTDRLNRGQIDTAVLDEAIADAGATIDSYLQQAYSLPLAQALIDASPLKRICGDLVLFYLYSNGAPEHAEKNHDKAIAWLRDIASGKATLGEQDTQAVGGMRVTTSQGVSNHDWETY
ncbi:MAG: DUF1320 domain-containing protein [Gammaproteobacteria bacterium]|nr:DUF1320 domain-containing protein [Gammaproteobacteria bacterium]